MMLAVLRVIILYPFSLCLACFVYTLKCSTGMQNFEKKNEDYTSNLQSTALDEMVWKYTKRESFWMKVLSQFFTCPQYSQMTPQDASVKLRIKMQDHQHLTKGQLVKKLGVILISKLVLPNFPITVKVSHMLPFCDFLNLERLSLIVLSLLRLLLLRYCGSLKEATHPWQKELSCGMLHSQWRFEENLES